MEIDEKNFMKNGRKMSRFMMWELIDKIEYLESCMDSNEFKNNFSCYQLDNFELAYGKNKYVVWGAGEDGKKVYHLLTLLNKTVTVWCDKNAGRFQGDLNNQIQLPEEMFSKYNGEIIIVASRKYQFEIMSEIVQRNDDLKHAVFEYDKVFAYYKHNEEYRKQSILSYPPLWMTVGVTSACSNHCLFCSYHGQPAKGISNTYGLPFRLSYEDFTKIINLAKDGGVPEIHICGTGEPFLNPDIIKMVDYVITKYGEVSLQTGFWKTLFDKNNYLDELIKRQKHITYISTDVISSLPEEHDRIKAGASYKELLETMDYIGKNSNLIIRAALIITKQNYKNIKGIMDDFHKRNINLELLIVNLLSYDYSDFTSSDNVYTSKDIDITKHLQEAKQYAEELGIKMFPARPADQEEDCYVFWREFQTWPVKGCEKNRYGENMIPHACSAVVRGELNSVGYLFDYNTIMEAWNNEKLVQLRKNMIHGKYPSNWCRKCVYYHEEDSIYK